MNKSKIIALLFWIQLAVVFSPMQLNAQQSDAFQDLDRRVKQFLETHKHDFRDMNVPEKDGQLLYDLVIEGKYTRALEIGTSTGYSTIYLAWALSKTGGKLITIEINEQRYTTALKHFEEAGLSSYIDARLANAHELVKELEGPFDFVFSDADKGWYKNYFLDLDPKLEVGGCYATHNITGRSGGWNSDYYEYIESLDHYNSHIEPGTSMLISYKIIEK